VDHRTVEFNDLGVGMRLLGDLGTQSRRRYRQGVDGDGKDMTSDLDKSREYPTSPSRQYSPLEVTFAQQFSQVATHTTLTRWKTGSVFPPPLLS